MLLKSHCWRHLVKCTKNFVFKLTCTARHASRWFINTGLKGGSFQLVSASHFCCTQQLCWRHGHLWLWKIRCSYWHQKNRSECLRGLSQAPHCPPLAWSLPLAPAFPSTLHLENSAPFPRHKAMEKKIPFFFYFRHHYGSNSHTFERSGLPPVSFLKAMPLCTLTEVHVPVFQQTHRSITHHEYTPGDKRDR